MTTKLGYHQYVTFAKCKHVKILHRLLSICLRFKKTGVVNFDSICDIKTKIKVYLANVSSKIYLR